MKLAIGMPLVDNFVLRDFFTSYVAMKKPDHVLILPNMESMGRIDAIRNHIVEEAFKHECSHLLFLDTDQVYPADAAEKFSEHMKNPDIKIISGVVHRRYPPFEALLYKGKLHKYLHVDDEIIYSGKVIEVDACGTGALLIHMDVFNELAEPWFLIEKKENGKVVGEDINFCYRAKKLGFEIFADTSIKIGHVTQSIIDENFYKYFKKLKGLAWAKNEQQIEGG